MLQLLPPQSLRYMYHMLAGQDTDVLKQLWMKTSPTKYFVFIKKMKEAVISSSYFPALYLHSTYTTVMLNPMMQSKERQMKQKLAAPAWPGFKIPAWWCCVFFINIIIIIIIFYDGPVLLHFQDLRQGKLSSKIRPPSCTTFRISPRKPIFRINSVEVVCIIKSAFYK